MSELTTGRPIAQEPKLDELMLAMDVVDTIRHQEQLVARELGQDDRDEALKSRLRQLYTSQGLEVSDAVLVAGIRALKESRFAYTPPPPGFARTLALAWIRRGPVALLATAVLTVTGAGTTWAVWQSGADERRAEATRVAIEETLPPQLAAAGAAALAAANVPAARGQVEAWIADGETALARGDANGARAAIARLDGLYAELVRSFELRIVQDPEEYKLTIRIPNVNLQARNYYVIVEAVTPDGSRVPMAITSEETGRVRTVTRWGVRISAATYNQLLADGEEDGIIQNNLIGTKPRGQLDVEYRMPVLGGAITEWEE